jgi:hypothetical protein
MTDATLEEHRRSIFDRYGIAPGRVPPTSKQRDASRAQFRRPTYERNRRAAAMQICVRALRRNRVQRKNRRQTSRSRAACDLSPYRHGRARCPFQSSGIASASICREDTLGPGRRPTCRGARPPKRKGPLPFELNRGIDRDRQLMAMARITAALRPRPAIAMISATSGLSRRIGGHRLS